MKLLEEAYKKAEGGTEDAGDLLYWMGVCKLKKVYDLSCSIRISKNLERAREYFKKALKEYPERPERIETKRQFVSKIISRLEIESFSKEKIKELINQGNGMPKI